MFRFIKNSQLRLLVSGTLFTVAFVWMAIVSYDVDKEEVRVFLILSFMLVGGLIICSFVFSLLLRLLRGNSTGALLEKVSKAEKKPDDAPVDNPD